MVRWNAAAALFTRFRNKTYAVQCIELAENDEDTNVQSVALVGLGELLPFLDDNNRATEASKILLATFIDESKYLELRCSAYEGILAAMDVLPLDRPPATKMLDLSHDVDHALVERFKQRYGVDADNCPSHK